MIQTKRIERPLRALEMLSMASLLKRARMAKVDKQYWSEESTAYKMTLPENDPARLEPTASEKSNIIQRIIEVRLSIGFQSTDCEPELGLF